MSKYRVFFSNDCLMYGVQKQVKNYSYIGEQPKWVQVLPPKNKGARHGKSAYTYYKGVAERWLKELEGSNKDEKDSSY